jgi:hypothetical protein
MRVAVLSESHADEVAIRILVDGILGRQTQPIALLPIWSRGSHHMGPATTQILAPGSRLGPECLRVMVSNTAIFRDQGAPQQGGMPHNDPVEGITRPGQ